MLLLILYYMRNCCAEQRRLYCYPGCFGREIINGKSLLLSEDVWYTYGRGGYIRLSGIVFSKYAVNKKKKKYTTRMIVDAFPLSDCLHYF